MACRATSSKTCARRGRASRLGRLRSRDGGAADARESFLEGRAQGSGESGVREARGNVQDRARLLLRHDDARLPHRSHHHEERPGERNQGGRQKPKSSSTARRSIPNPAARWPTRAASTTIPNRSKSPKCAARTIRSRGLVAHRIVAKEDLHVGDRVATVADAERRARNMRNHTATHLMHAALRNILGHAREAGRARSSRPITCASIFRTSPPSIRRSWPKSSSR